MKLIDLIENLSVVKIIGDINLEIENVQIDSNAVSKNSLFICINGGDYDGHGFVKQAEKYGAVAVVTEKIIDCGITQIVVEDTRLAMSKIASAFYGNVCEKMKLIGVVGTNGKTTTAHLIGKILNSAGIKCGVIGTIGTFYGEYFVEHDLTTPDPLNLHKILYDMFQKGYKTAVMEVSAHALYYKKVGGLNFEVGVFTNFSRDHLDFFKDMENYKKAKRSFFDENQCKYMVVNVDDVLGREIANENPKAVTYGVENPADVFAIDINESCYGLNFVVNLFDCVYKVNSSLVGKFNVYNALGASTASALVGVSPENVARGLQGIKGPSGRMELVYDGDFKVYVDYAHTPGGLKNLLSSIKKSCNGRLICVFGCGGNRDVGKRYEMGQISGEYSDFTVITSDNPRYEEPMDIISQVEKGVLSTNKNYVIVQERSSAIRYAIEYAQAEDVIVVAGKGCENYQEVLGIKRPYNDKDTIKEIIGSIRG